MTFFWVLSDFISSRTSSFSLSPELIQGTTERSLVEMASGDDLSVSDAALWMLLLQRLTAVTTDDRLELRNSKLPLGLVCESRLTCVRCHTNIIKNIRCIWGPTQPRCMVYVLGFRHFPTAVLD